MTNAVIGQCVTSIGADAFAYCGRLTGVTIPNSVTNIDDEAFFSCGSLTSVTIPNSVTRIGDSAFYDCYLKNNLTIPSSVTNIGDYAFCYCNYLTSVTCLPTTPPELGNNAFDYTPIASDTCPILVPSQSVSAYKSAWSQYADRIQSIS